MDSLDFHKLISDGCARFNIDPLLIYAIVTVESNWQPNRVRFEPTYIWLTREKECALKFGISVDTERVLQRMSFGLFQLMGGTCRQIGFEGMLTELLEPAINIEWGLKYFNEKCSHYLLRDDQIAAYNRGSVKHLSNGNYYNQIYVDKVNAALKNWSYPTSKA